MMRVTRTTELREDKDPMDSPMVAGMVGWNKRKGNSTVEGLKQLSHVHGVFEVPLGRLPQKK